MDDKIKAQIIEALEDGLDAAQDVLAESRERYRGYKPHRIKAEEEAVERIKAAIALLK